MRQYSDLSTEEIKKIAKECESSHFICVASRYQLDANTVALCCARNKLSEPIKDKEV